MNLLKTPHRVDEPLSRHTTWRIGGAAKIMAFPETVEHFEELSEFLRVTQTPYAILGNGSNMLVPDEGFPGVIIKTSRLPSFCQFIDDNKVHVGTPILNAKLVRSCAEAGLSNLEFLAGIPGTVGGAVIMNAGTSEGWVAQYITEVRTYCLRRGLRRYVGEELKFEYRTQKFLEETEVVLEAIFQLKPDSSEAIRERIQNGNRKRKEAQPVEMPSCGSVFRNPPGKSAWSLIEGVGLRGVSEGGAQISPKHTNFIVNNGGAKMGDVLFLIKLAKEAVAHQYGIQLEEEVVVLKPHLLKE